MTKLIVSPSTNTYFNLAAEEYFLNNCDYDVVFLYINRPAVVIGKHQNVFDECNTVLCDNLNVDVARRLSGGGTVYHGPGNINFSFIVNLKSSDALVDFKKQLKPIIGYLHGLGLPVEFSGRNDLLLNGYKISGNAEHVFQKKRRLIHHGTLLFNADLKKLSGTTAPKIGIEFKSHAVKSVRSRVVNIQDYLPNTSETEFVNGLQRYLKDYFEAAEHQFSKTEITTIQLLVDDKYVQWDWVYGYSPAFEVKTESAWHFEIKKGMIVEATHKSKPIMAFVGLPFRLETFKNQVHTIIEEADFQNWF